ncbi:beta-N-acetylhexosaminidase [Tamlana sp. 2_MG-2023]|uniref:beta-N-acetylhexosaminidase n=1 Tax=unclassified Tamlana TaxID=2614803 RepID=UPI0026E2907A|nr:MULTISPECIES: beta-N-acetylhexosaminidase [unclassified Tamlana]MDO6759999.1 beta-N-acetylhexosaminidase [Tamlana sp. 2_MG-2023]MDO6791831.1 beta-N-acetylhexosaminidase [Tamlana sp. 1_MG-2023]
MKPYLSLSYFFVICFGLTCLTSCQTKRPAIPKDLAKQQVIPKLVSVIPTGSSYEINNNTSIQYQSEKLQPVADYLAKMLRPVTGFELPVKMKDSKPSSNYIYLTLTDSISTDEGYKLETKESGVEIKASKPVGVFYGVQTLRQLLPASIETGAKITDTLLVATGVIKDNPTYGYRGAMLDVSRHFFGVEDVKRYIDLLSIYKMNRLHLHLTDDQGWRIEIKSWPKLTEIGGSTSIDSTKGGFYTQEQYKDIVKYAQKRFITIVPEIDLPGHTNAALASYPELNCDGVAPKLYHGTKVGFSSLCIDKEITYKFIDDVIGELAAITPGEYIHIGGDESHATSPEDYVYFIDKAQEIVNKHGKKVIGWDEVAHAKLLPNTIVQFWSRKGENAVEGVEKGAKILMSPAPKLYFDMKYDSITRVGQNWAGYIKVEDAYSWDLETYQEGIAKENILGIEAPLWTEYVQTMDDIEHLVFPRIMGVAEMGWTPASQRNWDEYKVRLGNHKDRLDALDIDYYASTFVPWRSKTNQETSNTKE